MGSTVAILASALSPCDVLAKYVFNNCEAKSQCCYHFCEVSCRTDMVPLEEDSGSEYEVDLGDIVHVKKS